MRVLHPTAPAALALFVSLGVASCVEPFEDGGASAPAGIIKGETTGPGQWQGVVAFVAMNHTFCTGTLIHPEVVLTAGHCVYFQQSGYNYAVNPHELTLRSGANVGFNGSGGKVLPAVAEVVYHPEWDGNQDDTLGSGVRTDLALVHLSAPVAVAENYCLRPDAPPLDVGSWGVSVGYGLGSIGLLGQTGTRRHGQLELLDIFDHELSVASPAAVCSGDSGGPYFTEAGGRWYVTGVASRGPANCTPTLGSVVVQVSARREWIAQQVLDWTGDALGECTAYGPDGDTDTDNDPELFEDPATDLETGTDTGTGADTETGTGGAGTETDSETGTGGTVPDTDVETETSETGVDTETGAVETDSETSTEETDSDTDEASGSGGGGGCAMVSAESARTASLLRSLNLI